MTPGPDGQNGTTPPPAVHEITIQWDEGTGSFRTTFPRNQPIANFMLDKAKTLLMNPSPAKQSPIIRPGMRLP